MRACCVSPTWSRLAFLALMACALGGCMLRPPSSSEETQIDSSMPPQATAVGIEGKPFCLHLRYRNHYWPMFSDDQAEAWVSDGSCASKGPARAVASLRVSWWYDWADAQRNRQCTMAERCSADEQHVVIGFNVRCAAAQAMDGPHTAFIATDSTRCH